MSRNAIIGLVAVLVLGFVGWNILYSQKSSPKTTAPETTAPTPAESGATPATEGGMVKEDLVTGKNVVKITSSGFSPQNITIAVGESVTWINEDTENYQIQSAVHPTHQLYPPLNTVGLLKSGEKKSLSFPDPGTYKYHDHLNPTLFGSVTVE